MIKTAELLNGLSLEALERVNVAMHSQEIYDMDALQLYIWLYRAGALLDVIRDGLKKDANLAFATLTAGRPDAKSWEPVNFAKVTRQPLPTSWTFPAELIDRESKLKSDKAAAKTNGTATKKTGQIDPSAAVTFKVSLTRC